MKRIIMEQSDLDLLHTVPPYHLQSLVKLRHMPIASKGQDSVTPAKTSVSTTTIPDIARYLFEDASIHEAIRGLNETEGLILRELVACGGRANSRDLALYFAISGGGGEASAITEHSGGVFPKPHPHRPF